ncbi:MAG TPA: response regulator [Candidatus Saccharimonadia bacterium]|nr:response regulator [Candidatus Saccharimonadia bacterium]
MKKLPNILIIEPDIVLAKTYQRFLEDQGYKITISHEAQLAIDTMEKNTPNLIIIELQLSSHNGYEFLYELRSYSEWSSIPVIVNSLIPTSDLDMGGKVVKHLGIVEYLYKPNLSLKKLLKIVEKTLNDDVV